MLKKINNKIAAISLFSGCGGLDIGAHMAGVPVVFCNDFDADSIRTLKANKIFKKATIIKDRIENVDSTIIQKVMNKSPYDSFILIGGPPCQPFSKAGYWISHTRRLKDKDPRNMIGQYLRVLSEVKPDGFLFENVESILHPTNKHTVENLISVTKELGYKVRMIKANALDYGVPQKRKRIIILGSKSLEITNDPPKSHASPELAKKEGLLPYETVGKFINKFNQKKYFEPEEVIGKTYRNELMLVPPGKNYIALTDTKKYKNPKFEAGKRFWSFLLKLSPDISSWTIPAQPGPWVGPFHWESRRLRVPEIAAIQTFPADYKFIGTRRSIQRQIGNAVPPLLGKAMIEHLIKYI